MKRINISIESRMLKAVGSDNWNDWAKKNQNDWAKKNQEKHYYYSSINILNFFKSLRIS